MSGFKKIDLNKAKCYSFERRETKSSIGSFASVPEKGWKINQFLDGLPEYLKAAELKSLINDIRSAKEKNKARLFMMGSHSLKVGLAPLLIDLMENGFISHLAVNGSFVIHDYEFAFYGRSSEEVGDTLGDGMFGMVAETPEFLNSTINAADENYGLGEILGKAFNSAKPEYREISLLAAAVARSIPLTVHVAIGADTIHQHPSFDAAKWGKLSANDFAILAETCRELNDGGIVVNIGSAVVLPEVFLKALNISRNIYGKISDFSAANIDMIQHYRPVTNVVNRPTADGGKRYAITGHFEILLPLIAWALKAGQ